MLSKPPRQIDTFLPCMRDVIRCGQSLHELNLMWRMIESSAKTNCPLEAKTILPMMAAPRAGFNRLEQKLVASLVSEKVSNALAAIGIVFDSSPEWLAMPRSALDVLEARPNSEMTHFSSTDHPERLGMHTIGLLVDALHAVPEFHARDIMSS